MGSFSSIRYFEEECINRFEKLEDDFMKETQKLAEYVLGLTEELQNLGLRMIQESLEEMNTMLRKSKKRLQHWVVESNETKQLITSLGTVTFKKTLFTNRKPEKVNICWIVLWDLKSMKESVRMHLQKC